MKKERIWVRACHYKYCVTDDGHTLSPNRRFPGSLQEGMMGRLQEITGQMKVNNWRADVLLMLCDKSSRMDGYK